MVCMAVTGLGICGGKIKSTIRIDSGLDMHGHCIDRPELDIKYTCTKCKTVIISNLLPYYEKDLEELCDKYVEELA